MNTKQDVIKKINEYEFTDNNLKLLNELVIALRKPNIKSLDESFKIDYDDILKMTPTKKEIRKERKNIISKLNLNI